MRAETDALTGLGNHGAFQRTLADVLGQPEAGTEADRRRAAPPTGPVALLMMDLDNFKAYNDRLGHPAGDALLHAIGAAIYGSARGEDRVFRYGGDEFAVLLPDVDARAAEAIGERVRQAVARLTAKEAARVTITVGVAAYPDDAVDKNDLIAAADIALYLGKQSGEDRVVRADEVPNEMRDLRSTLDRLARAALLHPDDAPTVDSLVEQAALPQPRHRAWPGHRPRRTPGRGALARRAGSGGDRPRRAGRPAGRTGGSQAGLRRGSGRHGRAGRAPAGPGGRRRR